MILKTGNFLTELMYSNRTIVFKLNCLKQFSLKQKNVITDSADLADQLDALASLNYFLLKYLRQTIPISETMSNVMNINVLASSLYVVFLANSMSDNAPPTTGISLTLTSVPMITLGSGQHTCARVCNLFLTLFQ